MSSTSTIETITEVMLGRRRASAREVERSDRARGDWVPCADRLERSLIARLNDQPARQLG